ncbi:MAG TPA: hypothetical protein VF746_06495 [Longimicrobium sp.]|jgi:hypothetical protein
MKLTGDAARVSAVERYGVEKVIPQYERYYERILAGEKSLAEEPALVPAD